VFEASATAGAIMDATKIAWEIKGKKRALKLALRGGPLKAEELAKFQKEVDLLLGKFLDASFGDKYEETEAEIAAEFYEEYYYAFDKDDRLEVALGRFYEIDAVMTVVGDRTYKGKEAITKCLVVSVAECR
jgi:hypothetical protein